MRLAVVFLVLLGQALAYPQHKKRSGGWGYSGEHGPDHWAETNKDCGGSSQSPIDVESDSVQDFTGPEVPEVVFSGFQSFPGLQMTNNGHAIQVNVKSDDAIGISGWGMQGEYVLEQFHFHWGTDDSQGSEHTIDGIAAPLEMHFVHRSSQYASSGDALEDPSGLAVLSVVFKISEEDNPKLSTIIENLEHVHHHDEIVDLESFPLADLLPSDLSSFYRYHGSLTTPPCSEVVVWTIFQDFVSISAAQMEAFRAITDVTGNFRPTQDLNDRIVVSV